MGGEVRHVPGSSTNSPRAMRLVSYEDESGPRAGVLLGDGVVPVSGLDAPAQSVRGLLSALDATGLAQLGERAASAPERTPLAELQPLAPVPGPEQITRLGLN